MEKEIIQTEDSKLVERVTTIRDYPIDITALLSERQQWIDRIAEIDAKIKEVNRKYPENEQLTDEVKARVDVLGDVSLEVDNINK